MLPHLFFGKQRYPAQILLMKYPVSLPCFVGYGTSVLTINNLKILLYLVHERGAVGQVEWNCLESRCVLCLRTCLQNFFWVSWENPSVYKLTPNYCHLLPPDWYHHSLNVPMTRLPCQELGRSLFWNSLNILWMYRPGQLRGKVSIIIQKSQWNVCWPIAFW